MKKKQSKFKSKTKTKKSSKRIRRLNPDSFSLTAADTTVDKVEKLNNLVGSVTTVKIPIGLINSATIHGILRKPESANSPSFRVYIPNANVDFDVLDVYEVHPNGFIWIKKLDKY